MEESPYLKVVRQRALTQGSLVGPVIEALEARHTWAQIADCIPGSTEADLESEYSGALLVAVGYGRMLRLVADLASQTGWAKTTGEALQALVAAEIIQPSDEVHARRLMAIYTDLVTGRRPVTDLEIGSATDQAISLTASLYVALVELEDSMGEVSPE